jgi:hypothetical protein
MTNLRMLDADERETLRVAEARHQMKLRPIMVERHLRDLADAREEIASLRRQAGEK